MNILTYYNSATLEGRLTAWLVKLRYYGLFDSASAANEVTFRDCNGIAHVAIDSLIYAETAAYYHRILNFLSDGVGAGQMDSADTTNLTVALIGSTTDAKSDDYVVTVVPSIFPSSLYDGRNSVQIVWNGLFNFKLNPTARGRASAGGASTLTVAGTPWVVNAYRNKYVHIIAGTGRGQGRGISSNTTSVLTTKSAWSVNPDATSQFYISQWPAKAYPYYWPMLGGEYGQVDYGTASGGTTADLDDAGRTFGTNTYQNMYVYIYAGTGIGQSSKIASNTNTKIVFTTAFTTAPDGTSQFVVVKKESDVFKMMYIRCFLWLYASNIADNTHIGIFNNLFENLENMWQQDPVVNTYVNAPYYTSDIYPKGLAAFDLLANPLP